MTHEALWKKKKTGGNGARFDAGERGDGAVDRKEMQFYVQFFFFFFFFLLAVKIPDSKC